MQPGEKVEYLPKERHQTATVRGVSECGRLVKIFKRSRTHWILAEKLKPLNKTNETKKRTESESTVDAATEREGAGSAQSENRNQGNAQPEHTEGAHHNPVRQTEKTYSTREQAPISPQSELREGSGRMEANPELHRSPDAGRERKPDMPTRGPRVQRRSPHSRKERTVAYGQQGMEGAVPEGARLGGRKPRARQNDRTAVPERRVGKTVPAKPNATILDACCGSKMVWFDRQDERAVFADKRKESHVLKDKSSSGGSRTLDINPDIQADFTDLPFEDGTFALVVFDPPHLVRNGKKGWLAKKYGKLEGDWKEDLRKGFAECFRVLKPEGTLIFKWNEHEVPVSQILALTPEKPLFGNRSGKALKTHWIAFQKAP
jgi:SAM-dependent methyltransferase